MRIALVVLCLLGAVGSASASRVVVMAEPAAAADLSAALEVALAARRVAIATAAAPLGALRLDRAATAQRAAVFASADAAVWIDYEAGEIEVCAVSADGRSFRHAPLPAAPDTPRVFAAIAASLVDELIVPPEGPLQVDVDVNVHVNVGTTDVAAADQRAADASDAPDRVTTPLAAPGMVDAEPTNDGVIIEAGPQITPYSVGLEGSVLFPVSPAYRLGLTLAFGASGSGSYFTPSGNSEGGEGMAAAAVELRWTGPTRKHYEVGGLVGAMTAAGDGVAIAGLRLGRAWEGRTVIAALSLTPVLIVADYSSHLFPAAWLTFRLGFKL
jgi:hypothetical protein